MKTVWLGFLGLLFLVPATRAQAPVAAGYSPVVNFGAGYSYGNISVPPLGRLNMNGATIFGEIDLKLRLGIEADVAYVRAPNAFNSNHSADLLSYIAGPVFYLKQGRRLDIYAHALAGAARETGVNYAENGALLSGYVNKFAWAAGGGAKYNIDRNLSVRFGVDYLNTQFFTSSITTVHQTNMQAFVGFSYRIGGRRP